MSEAKLYTKESLLRQVNEWKDAQEKIVFTNGCFDIIHLGHVDYLEKAAGLGDKLIVALNTDFSVSQLKGPSRPLNNEYARSRVMASFGFVSAVVLFGEETPLDLISQITPDILVKGKDYSVDQIVGANHVLANGGAVETIDFVKGYSTTGLIDKILQEKEK